MVSLAVYDLKIHCLNPISRVTVIVHVVLQSHKNATVITWHCLGDGPQERLRREDVGRPDQDSARGVLLLKLVNVPAMIVEIANTVGTG